MGRTRVKALLLDTHVWAWSLIRSERLSRAATLAITRAETILVSPISFFEIGQKARLGKWPEMLPLLADLPMLLVEQGGVEAGFDATVCALAGALSWEHRDPFDRLLAATARHYRLPLVSADVAFDGFVTRVW